MEKDFIAFFDMDGTLIGNFNYDSNTGQTLWSQLASKAGDDALEEKQRVNDQWYNDQIASYTEWADRTIQIYKDKDLKKKDFKEVVESTSYNSGVVEGISRLKNKNMTTIILTGGFKKQADRIKHELDIDHIVAACEARWSNGELNDYNVIPLDSDGKKQMMNMYVNSYKSDVKTTYLGDGSNDVEAIKNADVGISYQGHPEAKEVADYSYENFSRAVDRIIQEYEKLD